MHRDANATPLPPPSAKRACLGRAHILRPRVWSSHLQVMTWSSQDTGSLEARRGAVGLHRDLPAQCGLQLRHRPIAHPGHSTALGSFRGLEQQVSKNWRPGSWLQLMLRPFVGCLVARRFIATVLAAQTPRKYPRPQHVPATSDASAAQECAQLAVLVIWTPIIH